MKKRLTCGVLAALALATPTPASAHHPEIGLVTGCRNQSNVASVFVVATAWQTDDPAHRANRDVVVEQLIGDQWREVARGEFTAAYPTFTRALIVEAGPQTFRVRAVAPWGPNGEFGGSGETRQASIDAGTRPCLVPEPPLAVPTTAPEPKLPPFTTTTVPPAVEPIAEAPRAVPVVAQPKFTG